MLLQEDLEKLAYYTCCDWSLFDVYDCFKPKDKGEEGYWSNKYNPNLLSFYLSLDRRHRGILYDYVFAKLDEKSK